MTGTAAPGPTIADVAAVSDVMAVVAASDSASADIWS